MNKYLQQIGINTLQNEAITSIKTGIFLLTSDIQQKDVNTQRDAYLFKDNLKDNGYVFTFRNALSTNRTTVEDVIQNVVSGNSITVPSCSINVSKSRTLAVYNKLNTLGNTEMKNESGYEVSMELVLVSDDFTALEQLQFFLENNIVVSDNTPFFSSLGIATLYITNLSFNYAFDSKDIINLSLSCLATVERDYQGYRDDKQKIKRQ